MRPAKNRRASKGDVQLVLNDLQQLLDGPIGQAPLPKNKPLTPAQMDRLVKRCFNNILSHQQTLRLELSQRLPQVEKWKERASQEVETQLAGNPKVINPASIVYTRKALVLEQRLKVLDTMWDFLLAAYEDFFKQPWEPGGNIK